MEEKTIRVNNIKEYIDIDFAIVDSLKWISISINKAIEYQEFRSHDSLMNYDESIKNIAARIMILEVEGYPRPTYKNTRFDFWIIKEKSDGTLLFEKELILNKWKLILNASTTVERRIRLILVNPSGIETSGTIYPKENRHNFKSLHAYGDPYFCLISICYFIIHDNLKINNGNVISLHDLIFQVNKVVEKNDKKIIEIQSDKVDPDKKNKTLLTNFIKNNELENFFRYIHRLNSASSCLRNDIIILESKYQRIKREKRIGIITSDEYDISLNQISLGCLEIIDVFETNASILPESIELQKQLSNDSLNQMLATVLEENKEMKKRIESDYRLFEILDVHDFYKNTLALIELRSQTKSIDNINLINYESLKEKFNIEKVGLVNIDLQKRNEIIIFLEIESEKIFSEFEEFKNANIAIKAYARLIGDVNLTIKNSIS